MTEVHTHAIVLTSLQYRDHDRILSLFSRDQGLIKVMVYGASRAKGSKLSLCQPLTHIDLTYIPKNGEIHRFKEAKLIDGNLELRSSFPTMKAAFKLVEIVLKTQILEDASCKVFILLVKYLKKLPLFEDPQVLTLSFLLKILLISGQWTLQNKCSKCKQPLYPLTYFHSAYYCKDCSSYQGVPFDASDLQTLACLIQERSFEKLKKCRLSTKLFEKAELIFKEIF